LNQDLEDKESHNLELRQHKKHLKKELDQRDTQIEGLEKQVKEI
jgi:uncharacterized protein YhaN